MNQLNIPASALAEQVPQQYNRCFQTDCPQHDACARYLAGTLVREDQLHGPAVYPTARQGDTCAMYRPVRVIRVAYGFSTLFRNVRRRDDVPLRRRIMGYLGSSSTYYRYHSGEKWLTPEQQEWVLAQFRRFGYEGDDLRFDHYREVYDFSLDHN